MVDPCPPHLLPCSGLSQPQWACKAFGVPSSSNLAPQSSSHHTRCHEGRALLLSPPTPSLTWLWASRASSSWEFRAWVWLAMTASLSWASCSFWSSSSCHPLVSRSSRACACCPARASASSWGPGGRGEGQPEVRAWSSLAPSPGLLTHLTTPHLEELISLLPQVTVLAWAASRTPVRLAVPQRPCQELSLRPAGTASARSSTCSVSWNPYPSLVRGRGWGLGVSVDFLGPFSICRVREFKIFPLDHTARTDPGTRLEPRLDSGVLGNQLSPQDEGRGKDEVLGAGYLTACPAEPALPSAAAPAPDGPRGSAEPLQCGAPIMLRSLSCGSSPGGRPTLPWP